MTKCVNEESVKAQNKTIMNPKLQMKWLHLKNKFWFLIIMSSECHRFFLSLSLSLHRVSKDFPMNFFSFLLLLSYKIVSKFGCFFFLYFALDLKISTHVDNKKRKRNSCFFSYKNWLQVASNNPNQNLFNNTWCIATDCRNHTFN